MEGKKTGYYVNKRKCWLIVKSEELAAEAQNIFRESVNITTAGKRHLEAVVGSDKYKDEYCNDSFSRFCILNCNFRLSYQPSCWYNASTYLILTLKFECSAQNNK